MRKWKYSTALNTRQTLTVRTGVYRKIGERYDPNSFCILKYYEPAPPKVQIILSYDQYFFSPPLWNWSFRDFRHFAEISDFSSFKILKFTFLSLSWLVGVNNCRMSMKWVLTHTPEETDCGRTCVVTETKRLASESKHQGGVEKVFWEILLSFTYQE